MRKPCTDCPHFEKHHIPPHNGSRGSCSGMCTLGSTKYYTVHNGYYKMIEKCVAYAEYLAWQRLRRKKTIKSKTS